jgi:soluble lytic murein transglycosylase-like protein
MNPYAPIEESVANEYGLNPNIFENLANVESSQNPEAISSAGAQGLYQIMPFNDASTGLTNPFDPAQNAQAGAQILKQYLGDANGNYAKAIEYYNCGPFNSCPAGIAEAQKVLGGSNVTAPTNSTNSGDKNKSSHSGVLQFFGFNLTDLSVILLGVLAIGAGVWALAKG